MIPKKRGYVMERQLKRSRMLENVLTGFANKNAHTENPLVKRLLTPKEIGLISAAGYGDCNTDRGHNQVGGNYNQDDGGNYVQDGGTYNMDCADVSINAGGGS